MTDLIRREDALALPYRLSPSLDAADGYYVSVDAIHAIPAAPNVGAVKVKPLVWEGCVARTPFGSYVIHDCRDYREAYRLRMPAGAEGFDALAHGAEMMFDTQELAQSAAQADYDARILAAIETTPDPRDAVIAQLVEAVGALGAMPEGYCFCSAHRIGDDSKVHEPECSDLRAALAAAKEMMK